jgi:hypothetical protein
MQFQSQTTPHPTLSMHVIPPRANTRRASLHDGLYVALTHAHTHLISTACQSIERNASNSPPSTSRLRKSTTPTALCLKICWRYGAGCFKNFWQHPAPQDHAKTQQPLAMLYETPSQGQGLPEGSRHHAPSHSEHTHAHAWARDMESTEKPTAFCGYQQQAAHMRHDLHARATWRALAQHTSTDRSIKARAHMP